MKFKIENEIVTKIQKYLETEKEIIINKISTGDIKDVISKASAVATINSLEQYIDSLINKAEQED